MIVDSAGCREAPTAEVLALADRIVAAVGSPVRVSPQSGGCVALRLPDRRVDIDNPEDGEAPQGIVTHRGVYAGSSADVEAILAMLAVAP